MAQKMGQALPTANKATALDSVLHDVNVLPIGSVKLWADNPRKNDKGVPKVAESLQAHGQRKPIVVWRKNMTVYAGNTTLKAALSLGWKTITVAFADFPSEAAAIAYGIQDNKTSEYSDCDATILAELVRSNESLLTKSNTGMSDREPAGFRLLMNALSFEK